MGIVTLIFHLFNVPSLKLRLKLAPLTMVLTRKLKNHWMSRIWNTFVKRSVIRYFEMIIECVKVILDSGSSGYIKGLYTGW